MILWRHTSNNFNTNKSIFTWRSNTIFYRAAHKPIVLTAFHCPTDQEQQHCNTSTKTHWTLQYCYSNFVLSGNQNIIPLDNPTRPEFTLGSARTTTHLGTCNKQPVNSRVDQDFKLTRHLVRYANKTLLNGRSPFCDQLHRCWHCALTQSLFVLQTFHLLQDVCSCKNHNSFFKLRITSNWLHHGGAL